MNSLALYNEPGKTAPSSINITGPVSLTWMKKRDNINELSYLCNGPLTLGPGQQYYWPADTVFINQAFGLLYEGFNDGGLNSSQSIPTLTFKAPGSEEVAATFTYEIKYNQFQFPLYFPKIIFNRNKLDYIKESITAEKLCQNNKLQVHISGLLTTEITPRSIRINDKDLSKSYEAGSGLDVTMDDFQQSAKFEITDTKGCTVKFSVPVTADGTFSRCPAPELTKVNLFYSFARSSKAGETFRKALEIQGTVTNTDKYQLNAQEREGVKVIIEKMNVGCRFTIYTLVDELEKGIQFSDGKNSFRVSTDLLNPQQKNMISTVAAPVNNILSFQNGNVQLETKGDTVFTTLENNVFKDWEERITVKANNNFITRSISANGKTQTADNMTINVPIADNGKQIDITLADKLGYELKTTLVVMMKDKEETISQKLISAEPLYKTYFGNEFSRATTFIQTPAELTSFYFKNTFLNLKKPFQLSFRLLASALPPPNILFRINDKIDYFQVEFRNDSAFLVQKLENSRSDIRLDSIKLGSISDREIRFERRNNFLLEGDRQRQDWLLVNGIPFRNINPGSMWEDTTGSMGFSFPASSANYRFNSVSLSEHRIITNEETETYLGEQMLCRYFTGEKGDGMISKSIFDAASRKSFAVIIANRNFDPSPITQLQQPEIPGAFTVADSLQNVLCSKYQFDSSHVKIMKNAKTADLEDLFSSLQNPDYFKKYFGIAPGETVDLSEIQLMLTVISHGTSDFKVVLADGREKNMKTYLKDFLQKENGAAKFTFRSFLYVEDVCYGTFANAQDIAEIPGIIASNETLDKLQAQGLYDAENNSPSFHAAYYNLGGLSVDIRFMRSFVSTLATKTFTTNYCTDNDLIRQSLIEGNIKPVLLRPFREAGNNGTKDGRFLFLPRDKYKIL